VVLSTAGYFQFISLHHISLASILSFTPAYCKWSLPSGVSTNLPYAFLISTMLATCPTQFTLF